MGFDTLVFNRLFYLNKKLYALLFAASLPEVRYAGMPAVIQLGAS